MLIFVDYQWTYHHTGTQEGSLTGKVLASPGKYTHLQIWDQACRRVFSQTGHWVPTFSRYVYALPAQLSAVVSYQMASCHFGTQEAPNLESLLLPVSKMLHITMRVTYNTSCWQMHHESGDADWAA